MGMGMRVLLRHVDARLSQAYRLLALPVTVSQWCGLNPKDAGFRLQADSLTRDAAKRC
jgi:hypothetical protein